MHNLKACARHPTVAITHSAARADAAIHCLRYNYRTDTLSGIN
jgi:hypothetical protein